MEKLVVCIMGQNCEKFLPMCLNSVKDADAIVYCDGGSRDKTQEIFTEFMEDYDIVCPKERIENEYNQEDKAMNGKQRNFYLDYLKKNYQDHWVLCLDADEVVEDLNKIKEFIQKAVKGVYSVKMRHLIGDLGHEDATVPTHLVLNRLFQVRYAKEYPEVEHPVLIPRDKNRMGATDCTTIWHLAYAPNMWNLKKRYDNHMKKSNMHTPEYLKQWYKAHLFGRYPKSPINPVELPGTILNEFGIDKDELYFENRGLELKHFIDAIHWKDFFHLRKKSVTIFGCGRGPRVYALEQLGINVKGIELSQFAVKNKIAENVYVGDITGEWKLTGKGKEDLVVAYDLLEHIPYKKIDLAIDNLIEFADNILISVPTRGDPNLEADPTHIIKEDKEWWIKKFTDKGLELVPTPGHFLFQDQIMIFRKI